MAETYAGKSTRLGGGGKFAKLESAAAKSGARIPAAVAAEAGREKYGNTKMNEMAAKGRARATAKKDDPPADPHQKAAQVHSMINGGSGLSGLGGESVQHPTTPGGGGNPVYTQMHTHAELGIRHAHAAGETPHEHVFHGLNGSENDRPQVGGGVHGGSSFHGLGGSSAEVTATPSGGENPFYRTPNPLNKPGLHA